MSPVYCELCHTNLCTFCQADLCVASPLIQREGCVEEQGVYKEFKERTAAGQLVPTNQEWREIQIATVTDPTDTVRNRIGADQVLIDGKLMHQREYHGIKVCLPV